MNINGSDDPFYRYKMPKSISRHEGIYTIFVNIADIAKSLDRTIDTIATFLRSELGSAIKVKDNKLFIHGKHTQVMLQQLITKFVQQFVLCSKCDNPETTYVKVKKRVDMVCASCGHHQELDDTHKLVNYIIKNI